MPAGYAQPALPHAECALERHSLAAGTANALPAPCLPTRLSDDLHARAHQGARPTTPQPWTLLHQTCTAALGASGHVAAVHSQPPTRPLVTPLSIHPSNLHHCTLACLFRGTLPLRGWSLTALRRRRTVCPARELPLPIGGLRTSGPAAACRRQCATYVSCVPPCISTCMAHAQMDRPAAGPAGLGPARRGARRPPPPTSKYEAPATTLALRRSTPFPHRATHESASVGGGCASS